MKLYDLIDIQLVSSHKYNLVQILKRVSEVEATNQGDQRDDVSLYGSLAE